MAIAHVTTTEDIEVELTPAEIESLRGPKGDDSNVPGPKGDSAYQIWLDAGNTGTEADYLSSLVGEAGTDGSDGRDGTDGSDGGQGDVGLQGPPGAPGGLWGVDYRTFPGANDDAKLTAALDYAKTRTYIPNVIVGQGSHTWSQTHIPFSGMKLVGPNEGGPMNPEQGNNLVNHRVLCSGLNGFLFENTGQLFDVFVKGLCFQGGPSARFWRSTGNLYACMFDNLTFYGFKSVFGSAAEKALLTQVLLTGAWQVIGGGTNMQFHVGGSDCDFWTSGYCNIGPTNSPTDGEFQFFFDAIGKTNVGSLYCTAGGTKGIRVSANSEGSPVNFSGLRLEGKPGGKSATTLLQVDSGEVTFLQAWFAYATKMIVNPAAHVDIVASRFKSAVITAS